MKILWIAIAFGLLASSSFSQEMTKTEKQELAALAKVQKSRDAVKASLAKHPNDPQLKQKFVAINDKLAYSTMTADALTSHQKYSGALRLYRQSLKVNPKDPEAVQWVNEIERIYKSMHRPIPN